MPKSENNINRNVNKKILIDLCGGGCQICGYNRCLAALDFHHKNPKEKEFNISKIAGKKDLSYKDLQEIVKCVLLCANCHREIENGMHQALIANMPPINITAFLD